MPQPITLESLLKQDSELASLPEVYIQVSQLLDDEQTTAGQIGLVVEKDPALTAKILRMANSAFYGFPHKISSMSQAITILGRDRIRQMLIGTVVSGLFGNKRSNSTLAMEDFWYHSVKTAILGRYLCQYGQFADAKETLFTGGLLHKIGQLILAQQMENAYAELLQRAETEGNDLLQVETDVFGFNHAQVGAAFIDKWGLPKVLSAMAGHYSDPAQASEYQDQVRLLHLARGLVFLVEPVQQEVVEYALEDIPDWQLSGLQVEQITEACRYANEQVYDTMESLGMVQMRIDLEEEDYAVS
ncbi:MAG: HDOD domain-containing protein [Gammaproteobacteria bacterium]|nr:HDOD domain-containing protein [Gammaproteobacteria bacterium]